MLNFGKQGDFEEVRVVKTRITREADSFGKCVRDHRPKRRDEPEFKAAGVKSAAADDPDAPAIGDGSRSFWTWRFRVVGG